jgi:hypothetical protein
MKNQSPLYIIAICVMALSIVGVIATIYFMMWGQYTNHELPMKLLASFIIPAFIGFLVSTSTHKRR